jgi:hypothetical protein
LVANTGGASSPYANLIPNTSPSSSASSTSAGNELRHVSVILGGEVFSLPVADCPAASCQNGSPIAWASTNAQDQVALQAFREASLRAGVKDVTTIAVAGLAVATAGTSLPLTTTVSIGAGAAGTMDAAGQFNNNGSVDLGQTSFAALVGGSLGPLSRIPGLNGYLGAGFLGGAGNTATTAFNNWANGDSASLSRAFGQGSFFGVLGYGFGQVARNYLTQITPQGFTPNPRIPALFQIPYSPPSAIPANGSAITSGLVGGIPSTLPSSPDK